MKSFHEGHDLSVPVSRQKLEELAQPMLEEIKGKTEELLEDTFFDTEDGEFEVLLVGGSTRLLFVREWLEEKFGKAPNTSLNPEHAVA